MLTANLDSYKRSRAIDAPVSDLSDEHLERITDEHGNITRPDTAKQKQNRRSSAGSAISRSCYICRLWDYPKHTKMTCWRCKYCWMPLCKIQAREGEEFCLDTHIQAKKSNNFWKCNYTKSANHIAPQNAQHKWKYSKP